MILTGEPSGDVHAGPLIARLKQLEPQIRITGIGGPAMRSQGARLFYPIEKLSAMGLIQVIKQFSAIKAAFNAFKHQVKTDPPDLVVFIDYPGFNLRAAQYLKARTHIPSCYYIAPKVWAWNTGRIKKIKACMDHVVLILPFELPLYKKWEIPATYVGNPLMDEYPHPLLPTPGQNKAGSTDQSPVFGLLPGSRKSEIEGLLPVMLDTAAMLLQKWPQAQFLVSAGAAQYRDKIEALVREHPVQAAVTIVPGRPRKVFEQSDLLIAASGTVTLEAALCNVPTIIIYKLSPLAYRLGKLLIKVKYAGLANLIAQSQVMPELLQDDANPDKIYATALEMLKDLDLHARTLDQVRQRLGTPGAAKRCARIVMTLAKSSR